MSEHATAVPTTTAGRLRGVAAGLLLAATLTAHPSQTFAAVPGVSPGLYPSHTRITVIDPLSNARMDCTWGFACHGGQPVMSAPIFHLRTQEDLHRLSGWAQFGDVRGHAPRMFFALFVSRYDPSSDGGMPWNVVAFSDFRGTLMAQRYSDLARLPHLLANGEVGNTSVQLARSPDGDVLAMACWTASIEVEGVVVYAHGSPAQYRLARHDLIRQIRAVVGDASIQAGSDYSPPMDTSPGCSRRYCDRDCPHLPSGAHARSRSPPP